MTYHKADLLMSFHCLFHIKTSSFKRKGWLLSLALCSAVLSHHIKEHHKEHFFFSFMPNRNTCTKIWYEYMYRYTPNKKSCII